MQDSRIQGAVMFGRGRFQNGVLIDPKPEYIFDATDEVKLRDFRNAIWCVQIQQLSMTCESSK